MLTACFNPIRVRGARRVVLINGQKGDVSILGLSINRQTRPIP